uniref:PDZ domain-containing protein n=1 Tax=Meloidogyne enterolobii TaxID=390850 RepID=A0A6V7V4U2_MELEN|nr:unnamed protein product [Meloidogyne enterolobii]
MRKQRGVDRNLDVVHSGLVLWQQQKPTPTSFGSIVGRERIARLLLTKDQLNVQLPVSDESAKEFADAQQHQGIGRSPAAKLSVVDLNSEQQVTLRTVNVPKGPEGLGLSIKGGSEGTHRVPIVISKVLPGLSAAKTNQVFVGDLIVEVNGMSLEGKTHEEVVQLLKDSTGPHVTLTLKRDSSASPLLRNTAETSPVSDHVTVFKSALKTPMLYQQSPKLEEKTIIIEEPQNNLVFESEDDVVGNGGEKWKTICKIPLPLAFVSRYLWATDKLRSNAFEVRSVDGRSSGIIHCEDRKALEQWVQHIDSHINALNRKTIRMSNKYLHASDRIAFIGWLEERRRPTDTFSPTNINNNYYNNFPVSTDPRQQWAQRFLIFKGADVCLFETPPLNADELDKCVCMHKIYETALRTAIKRIDRREHVFALSTVHGQEHYCSFQSREQLHRFEIAFYGCLYKSVNTMQTRTFACSYDGRPAGLVIDTRLGFSLYDIPSKSYIWQYGFSELEASSDDGKMRVQFIFRNDAVAQAIDVRQLDVKDIECDEPLALVFTLHFVLYCKDYGS